MTGRSITVTASLYKSTGWSKRTLRHTTPQLFITLNVDETCCDSSASPANNEDWCLRRLCMCEWRNQPWSRGRWTSVAGVSPSAVTFRQKWRNETSCSGERWGHDTDTVIISAVDAWIAWVCCTALMHRDPDISPGHIPTRHFPSRTISRPFYTV